GEVTKVRPGPGTTAIVEMAIDDAGRPIHRDATLRIRPRLFLEGNFYVDLKAGSPSAPELHDGGTIPLAQTAIPVQLDQVLSALASRSTQLRESLRGLSATLGETAPALRDVSASLPELDRFAGRVRPLLRRAPATLDLAAPLLVQLNALLAQRELPALLTSAR